MSTSKRKQRKRMNREEWEISQARKRKQKAERSRIERHHRRPRCRGGSNEDINISHVTNGEHDAYHYLFGVDHPREVAKQLSDRWLDPDYYLIAIRRSGRKKPNRFRVLHKWEDDKGNVVIIGQKSRKGESIISV